MVMKEFEAAREWIVSMKKNIIPRMKGNKAKREKIRKLERELNLHETRMFHNHMTQRSEFSIRYGEILRQSEILDSKYGYPSKSLCKGVVPFPTIEQLISGNIVYGMEFCNLESLEQRFSSDRFFSHYDGYWLSVGFEKIWRKGRYPRIINKILKIRKYDSVKKEIVIRDIKIDSFRGYWLKRNLNHVFNSEEK